MTHLCVSKLTIIDSDNGLSPGRRQAFIWINAKIIINSDLRNKLSEILSRIYTFSFKKMHFKMSSGKWRPFCLGLNVLNCVKTVLMHRNPKVVEITLSSLVVPAVPPTGDDKVDIEMILGFQYGYFKQRNTHDDHKPAWFCTSPTMYVWRGVLATSLRLYPDPGEITPKHQVGIQRQRKPMRHTSVKCESKYEKSVSRISAWKCRLLMLQCVD